MNKRGQVFLMAAIIIVGVMLSLVRTTNKSTAREEPEAFFDLAEEIGFETKRVLDYGVINRIPSGTLAGDLLNNYSEYISQEDVAFVYGDGRDVYAYYYQTVNAVAVSILNNTFIPLNIVTGNPVEVKREIGNATIRINGNDYTFDLKPGQNFYFVLIKDEEGEQFVSVE